MKKITLLAISALLANTLSANDAAFRLGTMIGSAIGFSTQKSSKLSSDASHDKKEQASNDEKITDFIASNINKLALESAEGQGQTINALSVMMNKNNKVLARNMQTNFNSIFLSPTATAKEISLKIQAL